MAGTSGITGSRLRINVAPSADGVEHDALLRRVHAVLIRMVRSGPEAAAQAWDVVVDSCSMRAKRGGALTGPNPTDGGKPGTKYHVVVSTDGLPLAALPSAANVHDTRLFPDLLIIRKTGQPHGSGLGQVHCIVEHADAWLLANKRLDRRHDRLGASSMRCSPQPASLSSRRASASSGNAP